MEPNSPVQGQEVRIENDRVITGYAETVPEIADEIVWVASFLQNDLYHRENNDPAEKVDAATHQTKQSEGEDPDVVKTNLVEESKVVQSPDEDLGARLGSESCTIQQSCNVQEEQKLPGDLGEAQKLAVPTISRQIMSSEGVRLEPDAAHENQPDGMKHQDQAFGKSKAINGDSKWDLDSTNHIKRQIQELLRSEGTPPVHITEDVPVHGEVCREIFSSRSGHRPRGGRESDHDDVDVGDQHTVTAKTTFLQPPANHKLQTSSTREKADLDSELKSSPQITRTSRHHRRRRSNNRSFVRKPAPYNSVGVAVCPGNTLSDQPREDRVVVPAKRAGVHLPVADQIDMSTILAESDNIHPRLALSTGAPAQDKAPHLHVKSYANAVGASIQPPTASKGPSASHVVAAIKSETNNGKITLNSAPARNIRRDSKQSDSLRKGPDSSLGTAKRLIVGSSNKADASSDLPSRPSFDSVPYGALRGPFKGWTAYDAASPLPDRVNVPPVKSPKSDDEGAPEDLELLGGFAPAPVEWEERRTFEDSKFAQHMMSWLKRIGGEGKFLELQAMTFVEGHSHVVNGALAAAPQHETTLPPPDAGHPSQYRTSHEVIMQKRIAILDRQVRREKRQRMTRELRAERLRNPPPPPEPSRHAPMIDLYLRPGRAADARRCAEIMRLHREASMVVNEMPDEKEVFHQFKDIIRNELPLYVAVHAKLDANHNDVRYSSDLIVGFAFAEDFGNPYGAYQNTVEIQVYTHPEYFRKNVGKSLMDTVLYYLDPGHLAVAACPWIQMSKDWGAGGKRVIGKILCSIPHARSEKDGLQWLQKWYEDRWEFENVGCLPGVGRRGGQLIDILQLAKSTIAGYTSV